MTIKYTSKYESPWASPETLHTLNTGDWRYQRPITKVNKCSHCATCYIYCPVGCIKDMGGYYAADMGNCKGCGICAGVCPTNVIMMIREGRED
jgi:phenylglyoxylate dehydrogenase delta subunit